MKALLLYRDRDIDMKKALPPHASDLIQDLGLEPLFRAMSRGDKFLYDVAKQVMLRSTDDLDTIRYRQEVLKDCLKNASVARELYALTVETVEEVRKNHFGLFTHFVSSILHGSIEILSTLVTKLKILRKIAEDHESEFSSEGFRTLFAMLKSELSDDYFAVVQEHLKRLAFKGGVLMSARLGSGNAGTEYVLRKPNGNSRGLFQKIFSKGAPSFTFRIADRDEAGARALSELRDRGINLVANAASQSRDHIVSFFASLRAELAFYIGCLNLHHSLSALDMPVAFPEPITSGDRRHSFVELYDASLALTTERSVVGNALNGDGKELIVITGANRGGKSVFLRSIGLSQLMMQCGMFVPAESFSANICRGVFTHYRREEDSEMNSGKFDEELKRMSEIVDHIKPNSIVLFNESFAATNEREGSEIARQIITALIAKRVKVFFVTHMYEYARSVYEKGMSHVMFLQPERKPDGERTFKIIEGRPSETSFGPDLYHKIFKDDKIGMSSTYRFQEEAALNSMD